MTANFLIALAELLRECPMCHKVTLDNESKLEIASDKAIRTCKCGYKIELDIKENDKVSQPKILNESIHDNPPDSTKRKEVQGDGSNNS